MANNKLLNSNNRVLQSLDLYANDLLNVSHIVGNENYSTRIKDLEISTRDFNSNIESPSSAGNLLLRAGTADTSGYVRIFAGADSEVSIPSNLQLNPDGTAYFQETSSLTAEAPTINITGKGTNGTVYVLGKSNVQIGQGSDTTFSGLTNQVQFTDGNITANTIEETHSVGTAFVVENLNRITSPTGSPTSVFKVQNIDQKLGTSDGSSGIPVGTRLEGIQAESNCIDIHAGTGLKLSTDRGYGYLEISSKEITSGSGQFDHSLLSYIDIAEVKADKTIKLWTPKASDLSVSSPIDSRYIKLDQTDSGIEADSGTPGLKAKNDYTDIEADEKLIIYNNAANKLVMTKSGQTGTFAVDTQAGTVTGTTSVLIKVPTATSETHLQLQNTSNTLDIQAANGLNTTVVAGGSTETITGGKSVMASTGNIELTADSGYISLQSQSTSNYLKLDHTSDKLRANNQTAVINSTGTLLLENASTLKNPDETPPATYIKLYEQNTLEEKSGTIIETGTTSITLKADDANNQIVLTKTDGAAENPKSNLLTVKNNYETHSTENEFKILVPSNASVTDLHNYAFTSSGTILDIVATTINNQTSTETKLSSDSINIASMGSVRSQSKRNLYLTAGLDYNSGDSSTSNDNEILIALKDIGGDNLIRLSQTKDSKHDVLEVSNSYTRVSTSNYDLTASDKLKIKSSNHGAAGRERHAAFELDADPTTATVKLNDLKVNQSIKLGNIVTGDTTGLDSVNSVPAGTASVTVAGAISKLGLTGADDNLAIQLGGLKIGDNVSGSAAAGNTLLEVEHANVTGYTRVNNLDITGEIRIGNVASAAASADSNLKKANDSSIGVSFSNFSAVADTAHAASTSDLIVNVQDFSLNATQTGTISTGSTLDIDSTGALTIDSGTSIEIGTEANKHVPVTIDASHLAISGDNGNTHNNSLVIDSQVTDRGGNANRSVVKAETIEATSDFYGNNIHMYWDSTTGSLVFASVASNS